MKKILSICLVVLVMGLMGACKKSGSPVDQMIDLLDKATEQVEKAKDAQDVQKISKEIGEEITKISKEYPDFQPTPEEQQALGQATQKFMTACMNKTFAPASLDMSDQAKEGAEAAAPAAAAPDSAK